MRWFTALPLRRTCTVAYSPIIFSNFSPRSVLEYERTVRYVLDCTDK